MYSNKKAADAHNARNARLCQLWEAEFLLNGAVSPEFDDRLGFKDMKLSRTAHILAALDAFRSVLENKDAEESEKESSHDSLKFWLAEYFKATGCTVNLNTPYRDLIALNHGPNAVIRFEMLMSMGFSPRTEEFWEVLASNLSTTQQIEAGEVFACM